MKVLQMLGGRVLIEREEIKSSIYLPAAAESLKLHRGVVMQIGDEVEKVDVGDYVLYGRYAGTDVIDISETSRIMNESDILAILEKETE